MPFAQKGLVFIVYMLLFAYGDFSVVCRRLSLRPTAKELEEKHILLSMLSYWLIRLNLLLTSEESFIYASHF